MNLLAVSYSSIHSRPLLDILKAPDQGIDYLFVREVFGVKVPAKCLN